MEYSAYIKYIKISPKKLRFLVGDVKKLTPEKALQALFYSPKRGSKILYKAIKSAVDNSKHSFKQGQNFLQFKTLSIEEGPSLRRSRAGGKGTMKFYKRRSAHIKVILTSVELPTKKISELPATVKEAKTTTENKKNNQTKKSVKKIKKNK